MKNFFYKALILTSLPLLFVLSANLIIDPFNLNGLFDLDLPKDRVSFTMHARLYKLSMFTAAPKNVIILGDSRAEALKEKYFAKLGHDGISNMAYGGGTLHEAINTFWHIEKNITKLNKVYMGIPLKLYNESNRMNLVPEAITFIESGFSYYISPFILKASFYNLYAGYSGKNPVDRTPKMSKEQFWKVQLSKADITNTGWKKPETLLAKLQEMQDYCRTHDIELVFFIPPTHVDLQNKVAEHGLQDEYAAYKKQLAELGTLIDFDFPNEITRDKSRFKDPYHVTDEVARQVAAELVNPQGGISIVYGRQGEQTAP